MAWPDGRWWWRKMAQACVCQQSKAFQIPPYQPLMLIFSNFLWLLIPLVPHDENPFPLLCKFLWCELKFQSDIHSCNHCFFPCFWSKCKFCRFIFNNSLEREAKEAFVNSSFRANLRTDLSVSGGARSVEVALASSVECLLVCILDSLGQEVSPHPSKEA